MNFITRENLKVENKYELSGNKNSKKLEEVSTNVNRDAISRYPLPVFVEPLISDLFNPDETIMMSYESTDKYVSVEKMTPFFGIYGEGPFMYMLDKEILENGNDEYIDRYRHDRRDNFNAIFYNRVVSSANMIATQITGQIYNIIESYYYHTFFSDSFDRYSTSRIPDIIRDNNFSNTLKNILSNIIVNGIRGTDNDIIYNLSISDMAAHNSRKFELNTVPVILSDMYAAVDTLVSSLICNIFEATYYNSDFIESEKSYQPVFVYSSIMDLINPVIISQKPVLVNLVRQLIIECGAYYHAHSLTGCNAETERTMSLRKHTEGEIFDKYLSCIDCDGVNEDVIEFYRDMYKSIQNTETAIEEPTHPSETPKNVKKAVVKKRKGNKNKDDVTIIEF